MSDLVGNPEDRFSIVAAHFSKGASFYDSNEKFNCRYLQIDLSLPNMKPKTLFLY